MTHGSHWECIVDDIEVFFQNNFGEMMENNSLIDTSNEFAYNLDSEKEQDNQIHTLIYPKEDSSLKCLTYIVNKQLWTSYPIFNYGVVYDIIIDEILDEGNMVEAILKCRLAEYTDFSFYFMDTFYFKNKKKYKVGNTYSFVFNAFTYSMSENEFLDETIIKHEEKPVKIDKSSVIFMPNESGAIDDYKVLSPIKEVEKLNSFFDIEGYYVKLNLLNDEVYPFDINCYVSTSNLENGYIPKVNDSVNTSIWICGSLDEDN